MADVTEDLATLIRFREKRPRIIARVLNLSFGNSGGEDECVLLAVELSIFIHFYML